MKYGTMNKQSEELLYQHPGDMPEGTLNAIIKQAGITVDEFLDL